MIKMIFLNLFSVFFILISMNGYGGNTRTVRSKENNFICINELWNGYPIALKSHWDNPIEIRAIWGRTGKTDYILKATLGSPNGIIEAITISQSKKDNIKSKDTIVYENIFMVLPHENGKSVDYLIQGYSPQKRILLLSDITGHTRWITITAFGTIKEISPPVFDNKSENDFIYLHSFSETLNQIKSFDFLSKKKPSLINYLFNKHKNASQSASKATETLDIKGALNLLISKIFNSEKLTMENLNQIQDFLLPITSTDEDILSHIYRGGERLFTYKKQDYLLKNYADSAEEKEVICYARWQQVPMYLKEILEDINNVHENTSFETIIGIYRKFMEIHPYGDGNGRLGRLLLDFMLLKANLPPFPHSPKSRFIFFKTASQLAAEMSHEYK